MYTQDDIQDMKDYAADRGIRVMAEVILIWRRRLSRWCLSLTCACVIVSFLHWGRQSHRTGASGEDAPSPWPGSSSSLQQQPPH